MKKINVILVIMAVALISGCASQQPVTEITIPNHGSQVYAFANDIREALKFRANDPEGIKQIGNDFIVMNIVFNGANVTDNAYFRVVIFDLLTKLNTYYNYEGKYVAFNTFYYINDQWYNYTGGEIPRPEFAAPSLWLVGPSEASGNYLSLEDNTIYLSGTSYHNLTLAGDKLTLLFFNIDQI